MVLVSQTTRSLGRADGGGTGGAEAIGGEGARGGGEEEEESAREREEGCPPGGVLADTTFGELEGLRPRRGGLKLTIELDDDPTSEMLEPEVLGEEEKRI